MIYVFVFMACYFLLIWTYILYPLFIYIIAKFNPKLWTTAPFKDKVTLIVPAHNEEGFIREKVRNCLTLDFGLADWEVIIVSDGSTDATNSILSEFHSSSDRLKIHSYRDRQGKAHALNTAASLAHGDVLIFSDANVILSQSAPRILLEPFASPNVGAVTCRVHIRSQVTSEIAGESIYMKFENMIGIAESLTWSSIGVDGALYALRRQLFTELSNDTILDDFHLAMQANSTGKRIIFLPDSLAFESAIPSTRAEFNRKTRIVAGGFQFLQTLFRKHTRLRPSTWFMLVSHKVLRWIAPFLLITAICVNIALLERPFFIFLFILQFLFFALSIATLLIPSLRSVHFFYVPYYFTTVNMAALVGFLRFIFRRQTALWKKVSR